MVSSSHKPYFIYGQKVIDSVVGTPSINACSCNIWEIYTGNKTKSSSSKPLKYLSKILEIHNQKNTFV